MNVSVVLETAVTGGAMPSCSREKVNRHLSRDALGHNAQSNQKAVAKSEGGVTPNTAADLFFANSVLIQIIITVPIEQVLRGE